MSDHDEPAVDAAEQRLLERLRRLAAAADPVPPDAELAARSAFAYRRLDAELAELLADSLDDDKQLAGVRGATRTEPRLLSFAADDRVVELEITTTGDDREVIGQLVPGTRATVELRTRSAGSTIETDELGRFEATVASGLVSLRCVWPGGGPALETAWVRI